ncbi:LysE family transporter [Oculatella sp. LEGE 06141]|uniref:LysE family translocator n=1 Tax=Oculatella sp. LEGE 06141 TaxID=1828648 RepID=UPI0018823D55|nr:LysE family transporter [Oculatella sp. LEGE 06141]MBE9178759.1 LysE family transporter [Oculatella sp. LEGE 06141]
MDIDFFVRGLIVGFSIALPVGPIGVLCIRRTLTEGQLSGLVSGLGAATADAIYGAVAGFGLTFISGILIGQTFWLRLIGGAFLCYLGLKTILTKTADRAASEQKYGLLGAYTSTVFLTLTNPATVLSFVAVFAGVGLANADGNYLTAGILVLGVFTGSAIWWLLLSSSVSLLRAKFNPRGLQWLNRISGSILLVFGIIALSVGR